MHQLLGSDHLAAVDLGNGLMAQANPQGGDLWAEFPQDLEADSGLIRVAGARRNQDGDGVELTDLLQAQGVVALDPQVFSDGVVGRQFTQVLHQVEGEAVVVVQNEKHQPCSQGTIQTPRRTNRAGSTSSAAITKELRAATKTAAAAQSLAIRARG